MQSTKAYILDEGNLREAIHKSYSHKSARQRAKSEVKEIMDNLDEFVENSLKELRNGTYRVGSYRHFTIREKKEREVSVLSYKDRCIQNLVKNAVEPILINRMTSDMCAGLPCRGVIAKNKTYSVVHKMKRILKDVDNTRYFFQADIRKCYPSIKNTVVMKLLEKCITDKFTLALLHDFLYKQKELAIGDPISHLFCNLVISELIRYLKEDLKVKHVICFADDILVFASTKQQAKEYGKLIKSFAATKLRLHLKSSSQVRCTDKEKIYYCGRIYTRNKVSLCTITKKNYIKSRHKPKSLASYNGILNSCNARHLRYIVETLDNKVMKKQRTPFAGKPVKTDDIIGLKHTIVKVEKKSSKQKISEEYYDVQAIAQGKGLIRYATSSKMLVKSIEQEELPIRDVVIVKDWRGMYFEGSVYSEDEEEELLKEQYNINY